MPPKKAQKMALTDFLQDSTLGSWADEMDALPTAPAGRADDDRSRPGGFGGRDDFSGRESRYPPREELPLPTAPPYTAYIGNLAFDINEGDVEDFFRVQLKSIKIIKDREGKPKGFGYVEFSTLQDLKDGLAKTEVQLAGRSIRVSVAEPQKERSGGFDDDKFSSPWRRDGPLPAREDRFGSRGPSARYDAGDAPDRGERMGFGSKFVPSPDGPPRRGGPREGPREDREAPGPTEAESNSDWRTSTRRLPPPPERPGPGSRKPSGFTAQEGQTHAADSEEVWSKGSKFSPPSDPAGTRKSSVFSRADATAARVPDDEPNDWRSGPRRVASGTGNGRSPNYDRSPSESVPSTPNIGRRKLELLPRNASQSTATSPIGSPKSSTPSGARANPFGAARPVDATPREREIEEKLAQSRLKDNLKPAELPPRNSGSQERSPPTAPAEGGWRDRKGPGVGSSRPASATHSRAHSHEAAGASTPPNPNNTNKKYQAPFSFAALASEIPVAEGEEDERRGEEDAGAASVEASA